MTEPTSTAVSAVAVATGAVTVAGTLAGIPADALIASVVGAALAMSQASRLEISSKAIRQAVFVFGLSLAGGVFLGPLTAIALGGLFTKLTGIELPETLLRAAWSFLIALGAQQFLPAIIARATGEIHKRGGDQ